MNWLGVATTSFKKDAEGCDLFFPWGKLGRGRIVPSAADRVWAKLYLRFYWVCVILIVGPLLVAGKIMRSSLEPSTVGMFAIICVAVVVVPWIPLWLRIRAWPVATEREMAIGQAITESANEHGPFFLWIGVVCSGLMIALGILALVVGDEFVGAAIVVIFFAALLGFFVWMLRVRNQA